MEQLPESLPSLEFRGLFAGHGRGDTVNYNRNPQDRSPYGSMSYKRTVCIEGEAYLKRVKKMIRIFLVRHGQTAWNKEEVFRGTADIPLNDFGRKQAREVGKKLKSLGLRDSLLISSPLARAKETAEIIGGFILSKQVRIEQDFTDTNFGEWQGKAKKVIERLYPELYHKWLTDPASLVLPGGEVLESVATRAKAALYRLAWDCREHDLIIVSHRVVNKVLLCCLLGAELNSFRKIKQATACINILDYDGLSFIIRTLNDTCHLLPLEQDDTTDF